jgi:hypothetical protein
MIVVSELYTAHRQLEGIKQGRQADRQDEQLLRQWKGDSEPFEPAWQQGRHRQKFVPGMSIQITQS